MKKLFSLLMAILMLPMLAAPAFADEDELITTDMTVVGCRYDEESGYYEMAISFRNANYAVYDNLYRWYYTTANVGWNLDKARIALDSDGSEKGDAALDAVYSKELIPLGTVIEVTWSGMVAEIFPPSLEGIASFTFTGKYTDYSYDDIISQLNSMNEMRSEEMQYPVPDESEVECYYRKEFTVLKSYPAPKPDNEEYGIYTPSLLLVRKYGESGVVDLVDVGINANTQCVTRDFDDAAKAIYEKYIANGEVPQGTVIEIVWSGMVNESYPAQLIDVCEIKFTSKQPELGAEKLNELYNNYADEFNLERIVETASSASGDYPAEIMHSNTVYELVGAASLEISDDAIIGYTTSYTDGTPHHEGETNFSRETGLPYAVAEFEGVRGLAVLYDGAWQFFKPVLDMAPIPPAENNPVTGTADIFAGIALAGMLAWTAAVAAKKRK